MALRRRQKWLTGSTLPQRLVRRFTTPASFHTRLSYCQRSVRISYYHCHHLMPVYHGCLGLSPGAAVISEPPGRTPSPNESSHICRRQVEWWTSSSRIRPPNEQRIIFVGRLIIKGYIGAIPCCSPPLFTRWRQVAATVRVISSVNGFPRMARRRKSRRASVAFALPCHLIK